MANKNAATHSGHCQACGRLQKLPSGVLSKHGYKVTYGFFSGTCRGSGYKAFEESCDQVQRYIVEAEASKASLEAFRDSLLQPATENLAWVSHYQSIGFGRNGYVWRQVALICEERTLSDGTVIYLYSYKGPGTVGRAAEVTKHLEGYTVGYGATLLEAVTKLNGKRAAAVQREINQIESYIAWQQKRVAEWVPAALLPVTHKDKEGFNAE